jgi:uncharacterized ferredoxin-like protein
MSEAKHHVVGIRVKDIKKRVLEDTIQVKCVSCEELVALSLKMDKLRQEKNADVLCLDCFFRRLETHGEHGHN